ncbi:MAG: DUF5455 family protein [Hydrogenophaga sp.]|uniref:DUF5455 family protein n=1 Tax=Hydrogenophaga sp. TaxID=1904254 RepID=UPI0026254F68|nr:DUF5455 family protein [Hydrogenophaga sp.]MCW5669979.1 DUF5455 family protein [Hydrogenophaga sp.]
MPLFAAFFGALFSSLGVFLAKLFAAKLAIRIAGVAVLVALASGLVTAFNGWIVPLLSLLFNTQYGQFLGLAFPPVAGTVMTTYMTAVLAVATYKLQAHAVTVTANL